MTRRAIAVAAAAVLLGAAGCSNGGHDGGNDPAAGVQTPADLGPTPTVTPDGWRPESFGDAEISVPASWGHQTGDVAATLWCISDASVSGPVMIRPGVPVEPTCPGATDHPTPATLVAKAGQFVSMVFTADAPDAATGTEGDRVTTKVGAVLVRVQAPTDLRAQILGTLHQITTDAHGCPVTDAISGAPTRRPDNPVSVIELKGVTSVAACRYVVPGGRFAAPPDTTDGGAAGAGGPALGGPSVDPGANLRPTIVPLLPAGTPRTAPTLLSSVLLSGADARDAIHGIATSKVGAGPESDGGCTDDTVRGTEEMVLRVSTASGDSQIYLRYGGCHNGFDDGFTERKLTRGAVAPFVSEANLIPEYGEELLGILDDPNAPATSGHAEEDSATRAPANPGAGGASPGPTPG